MGRRHRLQGAKGYVLAFAFPVLLLWLAQAPLVMKCDQCGEELMRRSWFGWVCLVLMIFFIGFYGWVIVEVIRDGWKS